MSPRAETAPALGSEGGHPFCCPSSICVLAPLFSSSSTSLSFAAPCPSSFSKNKGDTPNPCPPSVSSPRLAFLRGDTLIRYISRDSKAKYLFTVELGRSGFISLVLKIKPLASRRWSAFLIPPTLPPQSGSAFKSALVRPSAALEAVIRRWSTRSTTEAGEEVSSTISMQSRSSNVRSSNILSRSLLPPRPARLLSMLISRVEGPRRSTSLSEGFLRLHTSSTASRSAVVPRKPPALLLWCIKRMVQAGNNLPLLLANQ